MIKEYFAKWWKIIRYPRQFFDNLPSQEWLNEPMTFTARTAWIFSFFTALTIFMLKFWPIGIYLVDGISGWKFIIILPVVITIAVVFFGITFVILGGFFMGGLLILFYLLSLGFNFAAKFLGNKSEDKNCISYFYYSSSIVLFFVVIMLLSLLLNKKIISFSLFSGFFNAIFYLSCLYIFILWGIIMRKVFNLPSFKAFFLAAIPVILIALAGLVLNSKILELVKPLIT